RGRDDHPRQGAAGLGDRDAAARAAALHLPAPGAGSRADAGAGRLGGDGGRLRDGRGRGRRIAVAGADERGGGEDRHPGRRLHAAETGGRPGDPARRRALDVIFNGRCSTVYSTTLAVEEMLPRADLVIGAVLVHGARAPYVVTREQLKLMKSGAVLVDVAIDQGGCFETSHPTTHHEPTFEVDGITHYCVANMPGAVPITSTQALTNATLPYAIAIADHGLAGAISRIPGLRPGVNVAAGKVTHPAVAEGVGMEYVPVDTALSLG